ncbi:MAG: hypothetical protein ACLFUP_02140 [Desulfobacteraceae bacterium]
MESRLEEILGIEDVKGVFLVSADGRVLAGLKAPGESPPEPGPEDWWPLVRAMRETREADLVFERSRLYVREASGDYLAVLMGHFAPVAKVRLNCDLLLPAIEKARGSRGLSRFFKRKKI